MDILILGISQKLCQTNNGLRREKNKQDEIKRDGYEKCHVVFIKDEINLQTLHSDEDLFQRTGVVFMSQP